MNGLEPKVQSKFLPRGSSMDRDKKLARPQNDATELAENKQAFSHCQWLYGEGSNREFCVNPVEPGKVWCRKHMEIVYVSAFQRQKNEKRLESLSKVQDIGE